MKKNILPKKHRVKYSQLKALASITKASLISLTKNPSTVVFSILFPLIFILIFGLIGGNAGKYSVVADEGINKDNPIYKVLESSENINFITDKSKSDYSKDLEKGTVDAVVNISSEKIKIGQQEIEKYNVNVTTTSASPQNGQIVLSLINGIANNVNLEILKSQSPNSFEAIKVSTDNVEGRKYEQIDFILPGQLGFSLLNIGVFGTAFVLLSLRETLVLKRFFATPISRRNILLGEGLARLVFAAFQASIIIGVGTLLGFTLVNGWVTFLQMIGLASIGLIIFLGFGFIISSIAKNVNTVPPLANLITLPQFLLSGTFFPIEFFPDWLQPISRVLPLTYLNEAMRKVAFEGADFAAIQWDLLWLLVWGIVVYAIAIKVFKWE